MLSRESGVLIPCGGLFDVFGRTMCRIDIHYMAYSGCQYAILCSSIWHIVQVFSNLLIFNMIYKGQEK